uniref:Uncharacterized protein LOC101515255 isoform X2 n=1 Tax=Cicer arietinum TaxID=3827 RepID=A0A3Q7YGC3_CICAR|nr:uncharacterized protein LOC101515255 isoform X2 [Cicer arietinum]
MMRWCGNAYASASVPLWRWKLCDCYAYTYTYTYTYIELVSLKRNRNRNLNLNLNGKKLFCRKRANTNSSSSEIDFDPELRSVLELATESELCEIERILFGPSYLSPLLKSVTLTTTTLEDLEPSMIEHDIQLRQQFIATLESRFFFLAADARSTLRGWRPSYRNVLLHLRTKFNIPCSTQLSTQDLELEIFLHLLHYNSTQESGSTASDGQGTLQHGLDQWKMQSKVGAQDFQSIVLKGGGIFTFSKIYQLLARKLSGKMVVEAANYQVKKELIKKGGQLVMINLESRAALLAAKQALGNISG